MKKPFRIQIARLAMAAILFTVSSMAMAQDLYDTSTLRTFNITFQDANWLALLRANYTSETNILADVEVDGTVYTGVGVRIRGNTSYTQLPAGSDKFSLKLDMAFVDPDQELMGYDTINLNNGFHDPTFSREVVYNNYVAQFIPNPRANNVVVSLNGQNWGVYINVQQPDKKMLRNYFANEDGVRIGCSNNPNGPGLAYNGPNVSGYSAYEVHNDGGVANPIVEALIPVVFSLSNEPLGTWQNIDTLFAIDPSIWSVVLENLLTDDDSYVNKGCDFMTYRNPIDNRLHLIQRDANETFLASTWSPTLNFTASNKPVLSRVLAVPELRQRYMSHYRVAKRDLSWEYLGTLFTANRDLIDAAVQADPKKLYSYTLFQNNFTSTVTLPASGGPPGNNNVVGLQQFVTERTAFLNGTPELVANGPTIQSAQASDSSPDPSAQVWISAGVVANGGAISGVELFYRPSPTGTYQRVAMLDDGASGDGAANDGVYGVLLPAIGTPGQHVEWYVGAVAANAYSSVSYLPEYAEIGPNSINYTFGATAGIRITEWMYSGADGEFIEFTNMSTLPVDMTGWSMDDNGATAGAFDLSAFGVVQPGESVVVTDAMAETFRSAWGLAGTLKIIGELGVVTGNNLGRNDQIHLFNGSDQLEDQLFYGDQTYAGSVRTQNSTGQPPCSAVGQNDVEAWQLSVAGDAFGSFTSVGADVGTPGSYAFPGCDLDVIFADGFDDSF
ncbi:CotH kinase family protein [Dokdonella sp.]|uniref:CotH kinase family protein n=1 Tax=Dokdonella sp. TaxID=2291710 RepID=UPI003C435C59